MADLGLEINLIPNIDRVDIQSVLNGLNPEISLKVNQASLRNEINNALNGIRTHSIKLNIDKAYLSSQVQKALSAANLTNVSSSDRGNNQRITPNKSVNVTVKQMEQLQRQYIRWEETINRMQTADILPASTTRNLRDQLTTVRQMTAGTEEFTRAYEKLNTQFAQASEKQTTLRKQAAAQKAVDRDRVREANDLMKIERWQNDLDRAKNTGFEKPIVDDFGSELENIRQLTFGTAEYNKALDSLNKTRNKFNEEYRNERQKNSLDTAEIRRQEHLNNLYKQASQILRTNPRVAGTNIQTQLENIMKEAKSGGDFVSLGRDLASARAQMEELGLTTETLGGRLKRLFGDHMNTAIAMAGLHLLQNSLQAIVQNVIDVDSAMTDLRKVSNATSQEYEQFLSGASNRAKELGATVTDVIGATSEFSRLGYDLQESATLGDAAVKYLNVSEYTNIEDAAQSLVSTMQAFDMEADEVGIIVDKFNQIGNNFAISSQGLGEAMHRSAAALSLAGNSLDESLALVTGANEIVQDPEVVGTWAKTLTMYLRAAKTEAQEAGIETEGMANSVSELRSKVMALTNNRVDIMANDNTYKSTVQIMREIADVYDEMSDIDQAALLELISGKRQANSTAALLSNWEAVERAIVSSGNALGSADVENAKYLDSIQGKLQQFQAQFQATSTTVLDSGFIKGAIDTGSGLLGAVQWLVDNLGLIPTLLPPIASFFSSKLGYNIFSVEQGADGISHITTIFDQIKAKSQSMNVQIQKDTAALEKYFAGGKNLTGSELASAFEGASEAALQLAKGVDVVGLSTSSAQAQVRGFATAQQTAASASVRFATGLKAVGASIASMSLITLALAAVAKVIEIVKNGVDGLILSAEEASEITQSVTQSFSSASSEIKNNITQVEELRDRFDELSRGVSDNGKNISLTTDEYKEYQDIVSQLTDMNPAIIRSYNDEGNAIIDRNAAISETISLLKRQRIEQAKVAAYGGTGENHGRATNLEAAYKDFQSQYEDAKRETQNVAADVATTIQKIYAAAEKSNADAVAEMQDVIGSAIGVSFEEFNKQFEGSSGVDGMHMYIGRNYEKIAEKLPQIVGKLQSMGLVTEDVAARTQSLSQSYQVAQSSVDATAESYRTMIQALYESNSAFYDLTEEQQGFLEMFRTGVSTESLLGMDADTLSSTVKKMIDGIASNSGIQKSIEDFYGLLADQDALPVGELHARAEEIADELSTALGMESIDLYSAFGFDAAREDTIMIGRTIVDNIRKALESESIDPISIDELIGTLNFDDLSNDQMRAMNDLLIEAGDNAGILAAKFAALSSVGELGSALTQVSDALYGQADSLETVSQAIQDYKNATENLVDGADTHEDMVSIYNEFAKAVNKGQINTEDAREQMKLLMGEVVSLEEAKQWISENEGLFLTGQDPEKIGQDLTGGLNTLHEKYNQLDADQRALVDSMMAVDWENGSILAAQEDVVALADAFGISAASLQQIFDLADTYSDYTVPSVQSMVQNIDILKGATDSLSASVDKAAQDSTVAWNQMGIEQRMALEALTEGMDIDLKSMTVSELMEISSAYEQLRANIGQAPTSDALINYFSGIKTSAGEAAVQIDRLNDGGWSIDVTNMDAVAQSFGQTEEQAKNTLIAINNLQDDAQNPITLTVNGEALQSAASDGMGVIDEMVNKLQEQYGLTIDTSSATAAINGTLYQLKTLGEKLSTLPNVERTITYRITQVGSVPSSSGWTDSRKNNVRKSTKLAYQGVTGKMQSMASGGRSTGGRTLVGELGRELWISRDGKKRKLVGENGMEVITMQPGDAIVPNNLTESLVRGGMKPAWAGANSTGALANLNYATGGKYTDWNAAATAAANAVASSASAAAKAVDSANDSLKQLKEEFDKTLATFEHSIFLFEENNEPVQKIVAVYKKMQDAVHNQAEKYRSMGEKENSEYIQDLQKKWHEYKNSIIDAMTEAYEKVISEHKNLITLTENWQTNAMNSGNIVGMESHVDSIISTYRKMQDALHEQAEYYRSIGYSDTSDEVSELSDLWWDYENEIKNVKQSVIDHLTDIVDQTSDALGSLQDVYDTLHKAADEYAENGGFISVDSYRKIIELGPQYMQYLKDENGLLNINEESLQRVMAAKVEQLALDSAMSYVERLRLAMQKNSIEELNQLLGLTVASTDATWGMVYANLALLNLSGDQYQAALHNINAIRSVAASAAAGIGKVSDGLEDMSGGMNDFLQYVMDMIKQQVQNQIDDLEDLKEAYADLIQMKKDSLEASREETDYQDKVANKVKEIAKLQQQINALSLDDSREAQAERIKLEEQMAELQKELADTQADYAYEAQVDSLDKMQDAYEEQKDAEIEKLENSISSQQKLYDQAIAYIESHWDTLYNELLAWNYEYGNSLSSDISKAWEVALEAAKKYGSFVAGLEAVNNATNSGSSSGGNITVGQVGSDSSYSDDDMVSAIVGQMYRNSQNWHNASDAERQRLDNENSRLALQLSQYGVAAVRDERSGIWYIGSVGGERLYDRYLRKYHSGGIAGDKGTLRQNEMMAVLETGEAILDKQHQERAMEMIDFISALSNGLSRSTASLNFKSMFESNGISPIGAHTLSPRSATQISFGDVTITGADQNTLAQHAEVNRRFVNEIIDIFGIKK